MISVTDPANSTTYYAYDTEDNLTSITDANNHTTSFAYNARGWVTQTTFPSTLLETYGYDAVGNLTSKTDRKNQTIQYVYDALNRLKSLAFPGLPSPTQPLSPGLQSPQVMFPNVSIRMKGTTGLIVAAAIIIAVLIAFPAYRVFFGISVGLGVLIAGLLYLRNKYRPITDKDVDNKRPLGLD